MLAAVGATEKHRRLVLLTNGAVVGTIAAIDGTTPASRSGSSSLRHSSPRSTIASTGSAFLGSDRDGRRPRSRRGNGRCLVAGRTVAPTRPAARSPRPRRSEIVSVRRTSSRLDAARAGDETAFGRIVEEHRAERPTATECSARCTTLRTRCQETLLRAWRGLPDFGGRSSLRTWLYRIATNASLDAIARRPKRVPVDYGSMATPTANDPGPPLAESVWIEPYPDEALGIAGGYASPEARYDQREAVELAFIAALQLLPATQRAVLILREVLGFSAHEVSESLDTTVASVNSALQRARKTVEARLPRPRSQQEAAAPARRRARARGVDAYVDAWAQGDVEPPSRRCSPRTPSSRCRRGSMWWRGRGGDCRVRPRGSTRHPVPRPACCRPA